MSSQPTDSVQTSSIQTSIDTVQALLADILSRFKDPPGSDDAALDPPPPEAPAVTDAPITGTSGDDVLNGTDGADRILGRAGQDLIDGKGGSDDIVAGSGDDTVDGGDGDDRISAGSGNDVVAGGGGDDVIRAGSGDDTVNGGEGDDRITLGSGDDTVVFSGSIGDDVITDFKVGFDVIDLTAFTDITSLDQLTFTQRGGDTVISAPGIDGTVTVRNTQAQDIQSGGSVLVACYCKGTMLLTPEGERAIETLSIGDKVTTADGAVRPIKWVGHRSYSARFIKPSSRMQPVTIRAGALGPGTPNRDLTVSPGHSMLMDGQLVNADLLVNGTTIVQGPVGPVITYVHVELDTPDAVLANGAASETYVNDQNRRQFENWQTYVLHYGEDEPARRLPNGLCEHRYPHIDRASLARLRAQLKARAESIAGKQVA